METTPSNSRREDALGRQTGKPRLGAPVMRARVLHVPLAIALPLFSGLVTLTVGALVLGVLEKRLLNPHVLLDQARVTVEFARAWNIVGAGALLAMLGGCVLGFTIARPLRRLARQLEAMATEGRGGTVSLGAVPEFAGLGEAYNRLVLSTSAFLPPRARYIFHHLASGVVAYGGDGRIETINAAAADMLELDASSVSGGLLREVLGDAGDMCALLGALEASEEGLQPCVSSREVEIVTRSGRRKTLGVSVAAAAGATGEPHGRVATLVDLSRIKEIAGRMAQQEKLAAVGSLAAGVAHEIRNPLASLKALAQLLREGDGDGAQRGEYLRVIIEEVDRLNDVVSRLVDFASPRGEPFREVCLERLVADVVRLASHNACDKGLSVSVETPGSVVILGRRRQLAQALLNVVINGIEAAPHGGRLAIRVVAGDPVTLAVANNGPPIPEGECARIFDPYHTTKDGGTGLGLAITQQILGQHDGGIRLENRPEGVEFILTLPAGPRETTTAPTPQEQPAWPVF